MNVKKAFKPVVEFLQANENRKVSTVLDDVIAMCAPKTAGSGGASAFHRDSNGNVIAIKDYYFKTWLPVARTDVDGTTHPGAEFGAKSSSNTGLNNMSKEGANNWSKQLRDFKAAKEEMLPRIVAGDLSGPEEIQAEMDSLEEARNTIHPRADGLGFDTLEELLAVTDEEIQAQLDAYEASLPSEENTTED